MFRKVSFLLFLVLAFQGNTIKAQVQVGDTLPFWSVTYIDWPPLWGAPQRQFDAVCVRAGQYCYVFSEVGITPPSPVSLDTLVARFDMKYIPRLTEKYGPIPDTLDGDQHIFIMWFDENAWGGYFDPGQQMTDSMVMAVWNRHSSEHELIYHAKWGNNISSPTVAHELGHLLHWGQDHSPEPPVNPGKYWEDAWVDEGFSTFAEMYLDENIDEQDVQETAFFNYGSSDIPLIWFSDYNQVKLFMLYMFQHYGQWNYISTLVSNQLNGIPGVENTLDILGQNDNFDDAFAHWCVANYVDDSAYEGGKYWYAHYNFNTPAVASSYSSFPTGIKTATLSAYASDYIRLLTSVPQPIQIQFTGEPGTSFRLAVIKMQSGNSTPTEVIHLLPGPGNQVIYTDNDFGTGHNRIILVPMCVDSTVHEGQTAQYTYSVSPATGINITTGITPLLIYPNPVSEMLHIPCLPFTSDNVEISILDPSGRVIMNQSFDKDFSTLDVRKLKNGLYFLWIKEGEKKWVGRFIKQQ